jgi:hypothetical protein
LFCATVSAEHRDVAPIPDDVAQKLLTSFQIGKPSPLSETLSRSLDNASRLLTQVTESDQNKKSQSWASQRMLLDATIQEIKTLRTEVRVHLPGAVGPPAPSSRDHASFNFLDLVEERFNRVIQSLEAVRDSEKTSARAKALARAKGVLTDLHEAPRAQHESRNVGPTPTFTHRKPTYTGPDHLEPAPEPQYLSRQHIAPDNLYAFNGNILLAALPSPTPAGAQACNYTAADLGQSSEIQITQEIKDLAASLGYSPVKIFQYVANEIGYEPYFGSLKGAMGTLYAKAGNPTDQASLLIALLRASNIPARYVLGTIQFDNDPRVLRWLGAKDYPGAQAILQEGFVNPVNINTSAKHIDFPHVWVEACVPYGNYRGSELDTTGNRWIPLDPSFKDNTYQAGIAVNVAFDYTTHMAKRTNGPDSLPQEAYAKAVDAAVKTLPPNYANNTVEDVGYVGTLVPLKADILPASLPYTVQSFNPWDTGLTAETAEVPDAHRLKFVIGSTGFSTTSPPTFSMPDIILKRVTLSYRGVTSADQSLYETLLKDGITQSNITLYVQCPATIPPHTDLFTCTVTPINLVPVIKLDGVERYVGSSMNYWNVTSITCSSSTGVCNPTIAPVINSSQLAVTLNGYAVNQADFTKKINMLDVYALQAYGFQASDRLITERAQRLLNSVRTITDPNTNRDDTLGEFLHIVGLKYMRYLTDAMKRIGTLDGGSGWSSNHIGQVSSDSKLQYLFDLPFAVEAPKWNLLVDVPGGRSRSVDLTTGQLVWKSFLLAGYAGSAYESYLWQENARLDAVSTVRGVQFANETGIPMLTITTANQATELPKLTSNTDSTLNYSPGEVSAIQAKLTAGYTIKLPRSHINYQNWKGAVWLTERNTPTQMDAGFNIGGGYAGGYTVGSILGNTYDSSLNSGFINQTTPLDWSNLVTTPATVNSWVGLGLTPGNTFAGDPVNLVTGNVYHDEKDIEIKGRGNMPIVFKRSYNSRATENGPFGIGWMLALT